MINQRIGRYHFPPNGDATSDLTGLQGCLCVMLKRPEPVLEETVRHKDADHPPGEQDDL
jgi:hypothetical protein